MSVIYVIFIRDLLSPYLTLTPDTSSILERKIFNIPYDEIRVDFSHVESISRDFAQEYMSIKLRSKKLINEVNVPLDLEGIMDDALKPK